MRRYQSRIPEALTTSRSMLYDRIQEDDMKQAGTIMAAFVYNTATRDKKLPRKPLPGQAVARTGQ